MPEKVSGSFRDPSGFMFKHDAKMYRQVNQKYREDYDLLMTSGLYEQLTKSKTLTFPLMTGLQLEPIPMKSTKDIQIGTGKMRIQQLGTNYFEEFTGG